MNVNQAEDFSWTLQRLNDRVSFSGWFFAMAAGLFLWSVVIRLFV